MQVENRAAPHVMLGVLTLLSLAALVLSLDTAPADAQVQLRTAAANTAAATSFVLVDTETAGPPGASTSSGRVSEENAVIVYQAPDRVEETASADGRTESALVVGSQRFERVSGGKWYRIPPTAAGSQSFGQVAANDVLFPVQSLAAAQGVVLHDGTFRFQPDQPALLLTRLLGGVPSGAISYTATVNGEFVGSTLVTVTSSAERLSIRLVVSRVDRAPLLGVPPPSEVTTTAPG